MTGLHSEPADRCYDGFLNSLMMTVRCQGKDLPNPRHRCLFRLILHQTAGLRGKGGDEGSSDLEKGEDRGDEGLSVGGCRAGVTGDLSASALRLIPLVRGMIGYRLLYSDGG